MVETLRTSSLLAVLEDSADDRWRFGRLGADHYEDRSRVDAHWCWWPLDGSTDPDPLFLLRCSCARLQQDAPPLGFATTPGPISRPGALGPNSPPRPGRLGRSPGRDWYWVRSASSQLGGEPVPDRAPAVARSNIRDRPSFRYPPPICRVRPAKSFDENRVGSPTTATRT